MDWCQLASIIIDLQLERDEFKKILRKTELKKYNTLINIYEIEKHKRVESLTTWNPYYS